MSVSKSASAFPITNYISVCGICLSVYEVPKGLPCLHSFCLECIRQWTRASDGEKNRRVTCPNCRKECVLPQNGVDGLPTNFFITERNQEDVIPDCSSCGIHDRDIVARCRECGFVCNECMKSHTTMRALKEHDVIMLDKLRVGKINNQVGKLRISKRHGIYKLEKTINVNNIYSWYDPRFYLVGLGYWYEINPWCCKILSLSKYQFAVPSYYSSSKVFVFGIDGEVKMTIDTRVGLHPGATSHPYDISVNSAGILYITDSKPSPSVKVHDAQGRFMRLFQLVNGDGKPVITGSARGIVINNKQQIIVGMDSFRSDYQYDYHINSTISIYTQDESFVRIFEVGVSPYYLAATLRDTLLVCANGYGKLTSLEDKLLEVDYSGNVLNTITNPINDVAWVPRGICCSKDGEIFVVNAATDKGAILRFSDTWQYTGCVASDLRDPRGIVISEDDEILALIDCRPTYHMAEKYKELKIFRRS